MKKLLTIMLCLMATLGMAQKLTIDLSKNLNTTFTQTIDPQKFDTIVVTNRVLSSAVKYTISIIKKFHPILVLSIPYSNDTKSQGDKVTCPSLNSTISKLDNETKESNIPNDINEVRNEIKNADKATCADDIKQGLKLIGATSDTNQIKPISLFAGDELIVTITKDDKNKWIYDYKTEQVNHIVVFYGFTYVPDILTRFPNYYAKQQDTGGTYLVSKMNGNNKNTFQNISPTVMFTYRFFKIEDQPFKFGLTGGFTYNTQTLGALFGPSLVIGNVITLNTGITFIQKNKLMGQYQEGQVIKDNLSFDQLHNKIWTYDMFFSIGFNIPDLFNKKASTSTTATNSTTTTSN